MFATVVLPICFGGNSLVDSGFQGMSCLMLVNPLVNPLTLGNRFTIESVSSVDSSLSMESQVSDFNQQTRLHSS